MSTDGSAPQVPLTEQKLAAEIQKLNEENRKLKESAWKSPTFIIAAGGFLISIFANMIQYRSASTAATTATGTLEIARDRWRQEKKKLEIEIGKLQNEKQQADALDSQVSEELQRVNSDIIVWDNALFQDNMKLMQLKGELTQYELSNSPEMAEATRANIVLQESMIRLKNDEKNAAIALRSKLEKRFCN